MKKTVKLLLCLLLALTLTCCVAFAEGDDYDDYDDGFDDGYDDVGAGAGYADTGDEEEDSVVVGMLEGAARFSLQVHTDDGRAINFSKDEDTQVVGDLIIGERVKVAYYGELDGGDAPLVETISVLDSFIGTVKDAAMSSVTIESESDGHTFTFSESDDTQIIGGKGIVIGKKAELVYEGALAQFASVQPVKVWEIYPEQTMEAVIEQVTDDTVEVSLSGEYYTFEKGTAYIDNEDATVSGNEVTLYFFGALDVHCDIQPVRVHSIYAKAPAPVPVSHHLSGMVTERSRFGLSVETAKGNTYHFMITNDTVVQEDKQGIAVGDSVKCYYTGDIDTTAVKDLDKLSLVSHPEEEPEVHHVSGKVVDATMNTLMLKSDKHTYTFSLNDDYKNECANGIVVGAKVKVYYTGTLKNTKKIQKVIVTRIKDK